jgi:hypothetical protein
MIFIGNLNKNLYISVISVAKPKNFVVFDEGMKKGNEASKPSSLQFL